VGRLKITTPSLGVLYIAAVMEKSGYQVKVLDAALEGFKNQQNIDSRHIRYGLSYDSIKKVIRDFSPGVVGVACQSSLEFTNSLDACAAVKEVSPDIVTVLGGPHPTLFPDKTLEYHSHVDFVLMHEAEYPFRDLVGVLNSGGSDFSAIDGIAYRKGNKIIVNPKTKLIQNLDELPFPARHLVPIEKYFKINLNQNLSFIKRSLTIITSRGCPYNCIFCFGKNYWLRQYRCRSPQNVLTEIEHLVKTYKIKELQFTDDSLTSDYNRAMKIFSQIKQGKFNLRWSTPNGLVVASLDEPMMRAMKDCGAYELRFAVESGSDRVLKDIIHKPVSLDIVRTNMKIAKKLGLVISTFFSMGYPGETMEEIKKTFSFIREIKPDSVFLSIATPLPGTDLMRICKEKGYIPEGHDFLRSEFSTASYDTENFTRKQLEEIYFSEAFKLNAGLVLRNFRAFIFRWGALMLNHPVFVISTITSYFWRTKKKDAYGEV
jgi:magnesium-protoporphyrin IX monomethyl ester (oxidative) cyclase